MSPMVERLSEVLSKRGYEIDPDMFHYTPQERPHSYGPLSVAILEAMNGAEDIKEAAYEALRQVDEGGAISVISSAILAERTRCLTIIQSIETTSAAEADIIEEIVQKVRGGE